MDVLLLKAFLICMGCVFPREREQPPRFAHRGSFEFEYSQRWKSLDDMEKQQRQQVEKNIREARDKLESEMEDAYHEHQANLLRQGMPPTPREPPLRLGLGRVSAVFDVSCSVLLRSAEAPGGAAAHGGDAQPGDAEAQGDAAEV